MLDAWPEIGAQSGAATTKPGVALTRRAGWSLCDA
jgi:hypothetical protein